ncbi:selenium-dependent molybdenum cofactor biosynthesis protein YqeB [Sedimentibacter sp. MB31-C6]|uniref:selenium-dependent molybdenum cofactor biosynthesis protein YqeB n=1 Tax=Sedimentibacter sp. MB31-C6 TaxID=3109366 RepID=UPI002DDD2BE7|nr:selenium-dependent molybdenum cofactor biosynthesis protein YqeB [Sedimentibacter sp. MB36-C1]WSI03378.1 selenium-dependent molybdenum cofactor biosynthesis protein YqeB [Sedimentibacter sp. MB36-C1]
MIKNKIIVVRGAGDIATGSIQKLVRAGFPVIATEIAYPSAIRRYVSLCEAVYEDTWTVEDITSIFVKSITEAVVAIKSSKVPIIIDPSCNIIKELQPFAVVDATLAKKNLGMTKDLAPITIALGPGFIAGKDVDIVVETMRGHNLGRLIMEGTSISNTGIPGIIAGYGAERVIHAPYKGIIHNEKTIGENVKKGEIIATINGKPVLATIDGILRGLIRDGFNVSKGFKIADIDPRISEKENCFTITDKARCIGGAVLEAILQQSHKMGRN